MGSKSNKYGYVGPEVIQAFGANKGIFDMSEINSLVQENKWTTGILQLIETQTGSGVSSIDFTSIKENIYDVHFLTISDFQPATDNTSMIIRFSDDGGSTFEIANYQWAYQQIYADATTTTTDYKSTVSTYIEINRENGNFASTEKGNAYVYLYHLGSNLKKSFTTSHSTQTSKFGSEYVTQWGSGIYGVKSTINAISLLASTGNMSASSVSLYGIRFS